MPVTGQRRKGDREVESRMRRLATLRTNSEIGPGDQVNTIGKSNLPMRHMTIIAEGGRNETPSPGLCLVRSKQGGCYQLVTGLLSAM